MTWMAVVENIATLLIAAAIILGIYALGGGYFSLIGFVLFLNLNYVQRKKPEDEED